MQRWTRLIGLLGGALLSLSCGSSSDSPSPEPEINYVLTARPLTSEACEAGAHFAEPLRVAVRTAGDAPELGVGVPVNFTVVSGNTVLDSSVARSNAEGDALMTLTCATIAGGSTNHVRASVEAANPAEWVFATVGVAPAMLRLQGRDPLMWDSVVFTPAQARLIRIEGIGLDQYGNDIAPEQAVSWSLSGGGSIVSATTEFRSAGSDCNTSPFLVLPRPETCISNQWSLASTLGQQVLNANSVRFPQAIGRFHVRVLPGPLHYTQTPAGPTPVTSLTVATTSTPFQLLVTDGSGQPIPRFRVQFFWYASDLQCGGKVNPLVAGDSIYCGRIVYTDNAGTAGVTLTAGTRAGPFGLKARLNDALEGEVQWYLSIVPDVPTRLRVVTGDQQVGTTGQPLAIALTVVAEDQYLNQVPDRVVTWSVTTGGGTLGSASSTTDGFGRASTTWTLGNTVGNQTVTAAIGAVTVVFTANAVAP